MNLDLYRRPRLLGVFAGLALAATVAAPLAALEQTETVTRSFTLATVNGQRTLVIDNLNGAIEIEGGSGDAVELTLTQTFVAKSAAEMARARQEVTLEVSFAPVFGNSTTMRRPSSATMRPGPRSGLNLWTSPSAARRASARPA